MEKATREPLLSRWTVLRSAMTWMWESHVGLCVREREGSANVSVAAMVAVNKKQLTIVLCTPSLFL